MDVLVIGGGNAALCAAIAAREAGARVELIERAPRECRGGNSAFTGGAFRVAYQGVDDLVRLMPDLSLEEIAHTDFGSYPAIRFFEDLAHLSQLRADAEILDSVVEHSLPVLEWLRGLGVRFVPSYGRQAYKIDGRFKFWGGLTIEVSGGGLGLIDALYRRAEAIGVVCHYGTRAVGLARRRPDGWRVVIEGRQGTEEVSVQNVILASGGFHANLEWRARYLGRGWDLAKVRGSRFNTGDGIRLALEVGARAYGNWSACHAVFYDANAPDYGDMSLLDQQKNYYTLGIVVNAAGQRFVDEGTDFRNYTYSTMGARVLGQPGAVAWQIFDQHTLGLLPPEYRVRHASRTEAASLEALAERLDGIDRVALLRTIDEYNLAVDPTRPFNPAVKDGRSTRGLTIPKSNWAMRLDAAPFVAYAVTCGITCTFGGIKVNRRAQVLDDADEVLPGLFAAGEMVGGLYYQRYAGGAGLTSGAVLGRAAGREAAGLAA